MSTSSVSDSTTQQILANLARQTSTTDTTSTTDDAQTRFLTLLTAQLQNQDPMNPMDNAQMTSQLAQISTVSGIEQLNSTLSTLLDSQQSSQAVAAASLVGHAVLVPGSNLTLTDSGALGGYELGSAADDVTLSIKDSSGLEVANIDLGSQDAGTHSFTWDGTAIDGSAAATGGYTVTVTAKQGDSTVTSQALQLGAVTSVVPGTSGVDLQVGSLGIYSMSDIKQIL